MSEKSEKKYDPMTIAQVVDEPKVEGKFFGAHVVFAGKEEKVLVKGFADKKDCIATGKVILCSYSEEYGNYFTIGEQRTGKQFTPRLDDIPDYYWRKQRLIISQNAMGHTIEFMANVPDGAKDYNWENCKKLHAAMVAQILSMASKEPIAG